MSEKDKKGLALLAALLGAAATIGLVKGKAAKEAQFGSAAITVMLAIMGLR